MTAPWLLWCDIETTGLDLDAYILEVGLRTTDADLATIAERSWVLPYSSAEITAMKATAPEIVREMHTAGNLWRECFEASDSVSYSQALIRTAVRAEILDWLIEHAKGLPMAGSSVRFDRERLALCIPGIDDVLHYRVVDVSSVHILAEQWWPDVAAGAPDGQKRHRVMPDLDDSIGLLRYYRSAIGPLRMCHVCEQHDRTGCWPEDESGELACTCGRVTS